MMPISESNLISVIIPYYNNAYTIIRALNSVYNQTYQNYEIILINDASPDWEDLDKSIFKYLDKKLVVIHHEINKNGAAARNTGIKAARGNYIAFLDADDEWNNEHLESSYISLIKEDCDLIFSRFNIKSNIEYVIPKRPIQARESIGDYIFIGQQAIFTPSLFIKASVAKILLFNEKLIRHQDYDLLLKFCAAGYSAKMSNHIGGIVHWENNDVQAKGGTWEYSLNWAKEYRGYLSDRAYSNFIFQFVVLKLFKEHKYCNAFGVIKRDINLFMISKKNLFLMFFPIIKPFYNLITSCKNFKTK